MKHNHRKIHTVIASRTMHIHAIVHNSINIIYEIKGNSASKLGFCCVHVYISICMNWFEMGFSWVPLDL